jgi:hypothetical protein
MQSTSNPSPNNREKYKGTGIKRLQNNLSITERSESAGVSQLAFFQGITGKEIQEQGSAGPKRGKRSVPPFICRR